MKIDIDDLKEEELIELNRRIVERLKFLSAMRAHVEMMEYNIGDRVSFKSNGRERQVGVLIKYNRKTVTVLTEKGESWNVSPHLLSSDHESSESKETSKVVRLQDRKNALGK